MVWKIRQSVVAALLTMLTATPALAADTSNSIQWVPLNKAFPTIFAPGIPKSWIPQLKLIGTLIVIVFALGIGLHAARIIMQYEDKSQAVSEIVQLVAVVMLAVLVLY